MTVTTYTTIPLVRGAGAGVGAGEPAGKDAVGVMGGGVMNRVEPLNELPWRYRGVVGRVRDLEVAITGFSDAQLLTYIHNIRRQIRDGEELEKHLPAVFAAVCVVARRTVGMRPYNVQLVGGYELHRGRIAEMATGEGKTLVATLPAALNALTGKGVHIVTVNDYLAQRDAELMGPIYKTLGLTVGVIVSGMPDAQRREAYGCDIVYGTNKEIGFDYLRDQIKLAEQGRPKTIDTLTLLNRREVPEPVMRQLCYAIVDEADSILIDESRTPLIIAAPAAASPLAWAYEWADQLAAKLRPRHDFELQMDKRHLEFSEHGRTRLVKILADTNTPSVSGESWQSLVLNALKARWLFLREQHYVIAQGEQGGEVVIVDEFTGRRMPGRAWSEGLQQAVQAKERLAVLAPSETLARTTYQHFFSLYTKLAGMTGTAATETVEFKKVYKLRVRRVPTHRPLQRRELAPLIYRTRHEKWLAVAAETRLMTEQGRPVLIGTHSIEDSEELAALLRQKRIVHQVLNAKPENAQREAQIVALAGQRAAVTIATNMAGRGTDIKLGPGVAEAGGLHVIATQKHESRRIDNQLIGRCGRQGDPGSCRFILSLQDPLLMHILDRRRLARLRRRQKGRFGRPLTSRRVGRLFGAAQSRVESMHYRIRHQLMEYEDWLNKVYHQMGTR